MIYLRQSTASQEVPLGYFLDSTDGDTAETGLTIANTDIKVWKTGATTFANKTSGGATHVAGGLYYAVLDATDTNTLGSLNIYVHVSGALSVKQECVVLAAKIYDSLIAASDNLEVDAVQAAGESLSAMAELASVPSATPSLVKGLMWLYMKVRNLETTTASASTVANDAGGTIGTSTISDNGTTFTKGEFA